MTGGGAAARPPIWWLAASGVAAALSLGLPWDGDGWPVGHQTSARVFVAATVVLLVVVARRPSPRLGVAALVTATLGLVLGGLQLHGGGLAYVVALALLAVALRRASLLPARPARRS
ncbi:MAG TPA: hypothetical protein VGD43_02050 [Micromonospora sp.]